MMCLGIILTPPSPHPYPTLSPPSADHQPTLTECLRSVWRRVADTIRSTHDPTRACAPHKERISPPNSRILSCVSVSPTVLFFFF